jgi:hypothetical protein
MQPICCALQDARSISTGSSSFGGAKDASGLSQRCWKTVLYITAGLREKNLDRAREDGLDENRALTAVDRIGAALVLERKTTIAIPDGELVLSNDERALDVAQIFVRLAQQ